MRKISKVFLLVSQIFLVAACNGKKTYKNAIEKLKDLGGTTFGYELKPNAGYVNETTSSFFFQQDENKVILARNDESLQDDYSFGSEHDVYIKLPIQNKAPSVIECFYVYKFYSTYSTSDFYMNLEITNGETIENSMKLINYVGDSLSTNLSIFKSSAWLLIYDFTNWFKDYFGYSTSKIGLFKNY